MQFQTQTGLNVQFAGQCLEANEWDPTRALANFNELRVRGTDLYDSSR